MNTLNIFSKHTKFKYLPYVVFLLTFNLGFKLYAVDTDGRDTQLIGGGGGGSNPGTIGAGLIPGFGSVVGVGGTGLNPIGGNTGSMLINASGFVPGFGDAVDVIGGGSLRPITPRTGFVNGAIEFVPGIGAGTGLMTIGGSRTNIIDLGIQTNTPVVINPSSVDESTYFNAPSTYTRMLSGLASKVLDNILTLSKSPIAKPLVSATLVTRDLVIAAGRTLTESSSRIIQPHVTALYDGIKEAREAKYELSVKRIGARESDQQEARTFYNAVHSSYVRQGISDNRRFVPTGPMADITRRSLASNPQDTFANELAAMKIVDQKFRAGTIDVTMPGTQLFANGKLPITQVDYSDLNALQRVGLLNSVVVSGPGRHLKEIYDTLSPNSGKDFLDLHGVVVPAYPTAVLGGVVLINEDKGVRGVEVTVTHELVHAGDFAITNDLFNKISSPGFENLSERRQTELLNRMAISDTVLGCGDGSCDGDATAISIGSNVGTYIKNSYLGNILEIRAYMMENSEGYYDTYETRLMSAEGITRQEARIIIEIIATDPVLTEINTIMNEHAKEMLSN